MVPEKEKKIRENLRHLVETLREGVGMDLIAIVLSGSRTLGEKRKGSDWDVSILARSLLVSSMKRYAYLRSLCKKELEGGSCFLPRHNDSLSGDFLLPTSTCSWTELSFLMPTATWIVDLSVLGRLLRGWG